MAAIELGAQSPEPLFSDAPASADQAPGDPRPFHVRSRTVSFHAATLDRAIATPATNAFALNLFPDTTLAVTFERVDESGLGHRTWVGHITDRPLSTVILTMKGELVSGLVTDGTTMFEIASLGGAVHRIAQLDISAMPQARDGVLRPPSMDVVGDTRSAPDLSAPSATPGADMLIYYSTGVRIQAGGTAQAEALAARYVAESNAAYARSGVNGLVRLLAAVEVPAPDGANPEQLLPLLQTHPTVQGHRNLGGVDLVALLLTSMQSLQPNFIQCGLAYIGPGVDFAYSVTATRSECDAIFAFTHEIGHNLGAQHSPTDGVATGPEFPAYARGYKAPNHSFRTVMAYECETAPACPAILNFSNPAVAAPPPTPGGQPTGTVSQNNARRLNELFPLIASYRASRVPPSAPQNLQRSVSGSTVTLSWLPPPAGGAASHYLIDAGTAPGLSNLVVGLPVGEPTLSAPGIPSGTYFLRVRAANAAGASGPSNEVMVVIP